MGVPSYHDLHIETNNIPRTSIFDLPFNYFVLCTRVGGWELWETRNNKISNAVLVAGEYDNVNGLRLDINGEVICDSLGNG